MPKRLKKILKRLLIAGLVLAVLGLVAFTWLLYWPLEGDHDDLMALVPYKVDFVLRTTWEDSAQSRWVRENLLDSPLHPAIGRALDQGLDEARRRIQEIEGQINANIPVEGLRFDVEGDLLAGEVVVAGNFCQGVGPEAPPSWQELLILTRVGWKTRCVAALKHGFVRDNLGPRLRVTPLEDEVYHLHFPLEPVSPPELRSGCGGGFVMPPENEWYLRRCKGVLAISNSKRLIRTVAENSHEDISRGESFRERPGYRTAFEPGSGRLVAAVDFEPLQQYLARLLEHHDGIKLLRRFLVPRALLKLNGGLDLGSPTLLHAGGTVEIDPDAAELAVRNVWRLDSRSLREGIAEFVPAKETFLVAMVRGDPAYVMQAIVEDALTLKLRRLYEENLRQRGRFTSLDEFVRELATKVGDTITVAVGRLDEVFDKVEYPTYWLETDAPDPMEGVALMVRIAESATPAEVDAYLSEVVPALGFKPELERVTYQGFTYSRCHLEQELGDYQLASPCFLLTQNELILTNAEPYMRRILDTLKDPVGQAMAREGTFRETMAALPPDGHLAVFVDLEKLTRVPDGIEPGGQPRGHLWDLRRLWVVGNHDSRAAAQEERARLRRDYPQMGEDELEGRVERFADTFEEQEYPRFLEEYRRRLADLRLLRSIGFSVGRVGERTLDARFVFLRRP